MEQAAGLELAMTWLSFCLDAAGWVRDVAGVLPSRPVAAAVRGQREHRLQRARNAHTCRFPTELYRGGACPESEPS